MASPCSITGARKARFRQQRHFRCIEQGLAQARLPLCRLDHHVCLHAGHRHGQRSPRQLLLPSTKSRQGQARMIVTEPEAFLRAVDTLALKPEFPAVANAAFLVSPNGFSLAAESASDNRYMDLASQPDPLRALAEHADLARRLSEDVPLITFPGDPEAMDGVFPNN